MKLLNIKEYFKTELEKIKKDVEDNGYDPPSLLIIDATEGDPANQIYIKKKVEDFTNLGWPVDVYQSKDITDLYRMISPDGFYPYHDCIIVQMPLADKFKGFDINSIPSYKDCDGLTATAQVMPATVRGIMDYLDECGFPFSGKNAVVIGRSQIVGRPMAKALVDRDMTVTLCHSKTLDTARDKALYNADLVVVATGRPRLINRDLCPNAFVVDVGINKMENGKLCGDFLENEDASPKFSTPVPGGVGLLTRLGLIKNCYDLTYGDRIAEQNL